MKELVLLYTIFGFIFGIIFGSFINAFVYRQEKKISISTKRSFCPHCKHTLSPLDLVPLFSFLFLRAKCRYCKEPISPHYFLIELITGIFVSILTFELMIGKISGIEYFLGFVFIVNSVMIFLSEMHYFNIKLENLILGTVLSLTLIYFTNQFNFITIGFSFVSVLSFLVIFKIVEKKSLFNDLLNIFNYSIVLGYVFFPITIVCAAGAGLIYSLIVKEPKTDKNSKLLIPMGGLIAVMSILFLLIRNFI